MMQLTWTTIKTIRRYIVALSILVFTLGYMQFTYMDNWSRTMRQNHKIPLNRSTKYVVKTTISSDNKHNLVTNKDRNVSNISVTDTTLLGATLYLPYRSDVDTNYTATPLMYLFSSWKYTKEKVDVHTALLRLWSAWPFISTAVFTNDKRVIESAKSAGWDTMSKMTVHTDCFGPPVLAPMFSVVKNTYNAHFYGYSNADIVFGEGLVRTLTFLHEHDAWRDKPLLIVGRRYNVDFINASNITLNTPNDVSELTKKGSLVLRSTDYFFTNKLFPWKDVPKVSIGRPFVVRSIIGYALKKKIAVIEATKTIEAAHLTTKDGNRASWHVKGMGCNKKMLIRNNWMIPTKLGHCECALLETFVENNTMHVRHRKANMTICK